MQSALVTGTTSGFGLEIVAELAGRGWRVFATVLPGADRTRLDRRLTYEGIRDRVQVVDLDVTQADSVRFCAIEVLAATNGKLDALVNNAGIRVAGPFEEVPAESVRTVFDVNTFGPMRLTRELLPAMRAAGTGRIVTISSVGALAGLPALSAYAASKAAIEGWAEALAYEVEPFGISVGLVEPQSFKTDVWSAGTIHGDLDGPYAPLLQALVDGDQKAAARAPEPTTLAVEVADLLERSRIRLRTPVGATARARGLARGVIPVAAQRALMGQLTGVQARARPRTYRPGRTVLVTGCSTGFGLAIAIEQARRGWHVIATMRSLERSNKLLSAAAHASVATRVHPVQLDVTDPASIEQAFAEGLDRTGGALDAVVNNAGVRLVGAFEDLTDERIVDMFATNVFGVFDVTRRALPLLRRRGGGHIVTIGSSSSFGGLPTWSAYAATKFAITGWADSLAYEIAPFGIHTSVVAPGAYGTDIWREGTEVPHPAGPYEAMVAHMASADAKAAESDRDPAEVAKAVADTLAARRPPFFRPVGRGAWARWAARGVVPDGMQRAVFNRLSGLSRNDG